MRLRLLQGSKLKVRFRGETESYYSGVLFSPEADVPDRLGERILNNPHLKDKFKVVAAVEPKPKLVCDKCGKEVATKAALGAHKRVHKEN